MTQIFRCLAGAALAVAMFTAAAAAQEPVPKPDPGITSQDNCISESEHYDKEGERVSYRITLTNKCEQRMKCRIYAYIINPMGPAKGRTTMILAPKSSGDAATKFYDMRVKLPGGMAQVARQCTAIDE